ncbi:MAG: glycerol-3-phosphate 1-O-acyltransferase PlsY [Candidatus Eisenbacteria bacterium]|nr:glycerol-3-phosphate 1-O-acyltransferase PlsY [Candidatus Eisenbacteria bacterium]
MDRIVLTVLFGYLLGSIPFSLIVGKLSKGVDPRDHGSGNLGAANTFRTLGAAPGVGVLLLDVSKGAMSALAGSLLWRQGIGLGEVDLMLLGGVSAVCGHIWTVFASFRGGKGVAAAAGMFLSIAPAALGVSLAVWVLVVARWRYVSLGSIAGAVVLPVAVYFTSAGRVNGWESMFGVSLAVAVLVLVAHRSNIRRILQRTERKLSLRGG